MKLRIALGLAGVLLLAALVGVPSWTKATAQDAAYEIEFVSAGANLDQSVDEEAPAVQLAQAGAGGYGHWINTARKCQIEKWWAPNGLRFCSDIYIGGRKYHVEGVRGRTIYVS